ncbi:MAG: HD domain-containing protein [Acidobacteria bacterium]|nr:HD domain-containing protein [Acidobacteriota bacterium]
MTLTRRFEEALAYANEAQGKQKRKGTDVPYLAHLLEVASIVLQHGGDEDEAIAALLHDAPEDAGGHARLADIRTRFGDRVADIVDGCSDTFESPKPSWRPRKEAYLARIPSLSPSARLVSAADKLANARATLDDYRSLGDSLWVRFNGGADTPWYYRAAADAFLAVDRSSIAERLHLVVSELCRVTGYQAH